MSTVIYIPLAKEFRLLPLQVKLCRERIAEVSRIVVIETPPGVSWLWTGGPWRLHRDVADKLGVEIASVPDGVLNRTPVARIAFIFRWLLQVIHDQNEDYGLVLSGDVLPIKQMVISDRIARLPWQSHTWYGTPKQSTGSWRSAAVQRDSKTGFEYIEPGFLHADKLVTMGDFPDCKIKEIEKIFSVKIPTHDDVREVFLPKQSIALPRADHDVLTAAERSVPSVATSVATSEADRRKQICQDCQDRPDGCWKAIDYDCMRKYRNAESRATSNGSCPLNKWALPIVSPIVSPGQSAIIIGVFASSLAKYAPRIELCEKTWLPDAREAGITTAVVLSGTGGTGGYDGVRLLVDVPDSYEELPQKTRALCEWALTIDGWEYLFKCDDDTYVSVPRALQFRHAGREYIGARCRSSGVSYAHGGAGYFLSRRAVEIVAENLVQKTGGEDYWVGVALNNAGVPFSRDQRFIGAGSFANRPRPINSIVTSHRLSRNLTMLTHAECGLHGRSPAPRVHNHVKEKVTMIRAMHRAKKARA